MPASLPSPWSTGPLPPSHTRCRAPCSPSLPGRRGPYLPGPSRLVGGSDAAAVVIERLPVRGQALLLLLLEGLEVGVLLLQLPLEPLRLPLLLQLLPLVLLGPRGGRAAQQRGLGRGRQALSLANRDAGSSPGAGPDPLPCGVPIPLQHRGSAAAASQRKPGTPLPAAGPVPGAAVAGGSRAVAAPPLACDGYTPGGAGGSKGQGGEAGGGGIRGQDRWGEDEESGQRPERDRWGGMSPRRVGDEEEAGVEGP